VSSKVVIDYDVTALFYFFKPSVNSLLFAAETLSLRSSLELFDTTAGRAERIMSADLPVPHPRRLLGDQL
jgi:hypothetical protein